MLYTEKYKARKKKKWKFYCRVPWAGVIRIRNGLYYSIDVRLRELDLFEMTQKSKGFRTDDKYIDESQPQFAFSPSFVPASYDETSDRWKEKKRKKRANNFFHYLRIFWRGWLTIWNPLPSSAATPRRDWLFSIRSENYSLPMQRIISFFFSSIAIYTVVGSSLVYRNNMGLLLDIIVNWIVVCIVF